MFRAIGIVAFVSTLALMAFSVLSKPRQPPNQPESAATPLPPKTPPLPLVPLPQVDIVSWERGGFDNVAVMNLKLTNLSKDAWIKDIQVSCIFKGNSGTIISSNRVTVYEIIQPNKSHVAKKLNLGFIQQQVKTASCHAASAKTAPGREVL